MRESPNQRSLVSQDKKGSARIFEMMSTALSKKMRLMTTATRAALIGNYIMSIQILFTSPTVSQSFCFSSCHEDIHSRLFQRRGGNGSIDRPRSARTAGRILFRSVGATRGQREARSGPGPPWDPEKRGKPSTARERPPSWRGTSYEGETRSLNAYRFRQ